MSPPLPRSAHHLSPASAVGLREGEEGGFLPQVLGDVQADQTGPPRSATTWLRTPLELGRLLLEGEEVILGGHSWSGGLAPGWGCRKSHQEALWRSDCPLPSPSIRPTPFLCASRETPKPCLAWLLKGWMWPLSFQLTAQSRRGRIGRLLGEDEPRQDPGTIQRRCQAGPVLENKADASFKLFAKASDSAAKRCKSTPCCQLKSGGKQEFPKESPRFPDVNPYGKRKTSVHF